MVTDIIRKKVLKDNTVRTHLLKTISWRVIGTIDTILLAWLITGRLEIGAKIGGLELITKMLLYFLHERVWHKISPGVPANTNDAETGK
jgi:uncharacterized membrane protein